jgi:hypothetical protein
MNVRRLFGLVGMLVAGVLTLPSSALAGQLLDEAVDSLRNDPVYVDPEAERAIDASEEAALEERIRTSTAGPVYVAILPAAAADETGGDAGAVVAELHDELDRDGTYAVVVGNSFRAGSTALEQGEAGRLATAAIDENGAEGVAPTLLDFVNRVAAAQTDGSQSPGDSDGGGSGGLWGLLAIIAVPVGLFLVARRRRAREQAAEFAEVRAQAEDDLVALADDVRALELDVDLPQTDPRAREAYNHALGAYERAGDSLDRARTPEDLAQVSAALEEGRYDMASARARLEGREPPERRPPCFFDPRHGPSVRDVDWAPAGGAPRPIPACAADAALVEQGLEPASREVTAAGRRVPYWAASPAYGPSAGGFFGGFAGVLPAFLIGSSLGWGMGQWGEDPVGDGDFGGDHGGGGDFGGFGGGDFGGGGGDFGGGGE